MTATTMTNAELGACMQDYLAHVKKFRALTGRLEFIRVGFRKLGDHLGDSGLDKSLIDGLPDPGMLRQLVHDLEEERASVATLADRLNELFAIEMFKKW